MELLGLRLEILKKYEAPDPDATSLEDDPSPYCSYCGKAKSEVNGMVHSNDIYICNECVTIAHDILFGPPSEGAHE
jgi:hypothetical protein